MSASGPLASTNADTAAPATGGTGILQRLRRLIGDRRGVGAVEFAIIAPILLALYIGAFETTVAFSAGKRATRAAGSVADLITQQSVPITKAKLGEMANVVSAIYAPYSASGMKLKISGIAVDSAATKATIQWSWEYPSNTAPYIKNSIVQLPPDLMKAGSFVVHSELAIPHELMLFLANLTQMKSKTITLQREFYYRQRVGTGVICTDC